MGRVRYPTRAPSRPSSRARVASRRCDCQLPVLEVSWSRDGRRARPTDRTVRGYVSVEIPGGGWSCRRRWSFPHPGWPSAAGAAAWRGQGRHSGGALRAVIETVKAGARPSAPTRPFTITVTPPDAARCWRPSPEQWGVVITGAESADSRIAVRARRSESRARGEPLPDGPYELSCGKRLWSQQPLSRAGHCCTLMRER